jgi:hypothetical protein
MKKSSVQIFGYHYRFLYLIIFLIILLIILPIIFKYISLILRNYNSKEEFTTRIREMYRPYFRNIRLTKDTYSTQIKNTFFTFIRKIGLI